MCGLGYLDSGTPWEILRSYTYPTGNQRRRHERHKSVLTIPRVIALYKCVWCALSIPRETFLACTRAHRLASVIICFFFFLIIFSSGPLSLSFSLFIFCFANCTRSVHMGRTNRGILVLAALQSLSYFLQPRWVTKSSSHDLYESMSIKAICIHGMKLQIRTEKTASPNCVPT